MFYSILGGSWGIVHPNFLKPPPLHLSYYMPIHHGFTAPFPYLLKLVIFDVCPKPPNDPPSSPPSSPRTQTQLRYTSRHAWPASPAHCMPGGGHPPASFSVHWPWKSPLGGARVVTASLTNTPRSFVRPLQGQYVNTLIVRLSPFVPDYRSVTWLTYGGGGQWGDSGGTTV